MAHSDSAVLAHEVVPRSIRLAAICYLVMCAVLVLYLVLRATMGILAWRDLSPALGSLIALYLWWALRSGDREARTTGLVLGAITIVLSGAFLVYGILQLPLLDTPRHAVLILGHALFLGPLVAFVAACTAVTQLLRPESKAFFGSVAGS